MTAFFKEIEPFRGNGNENEKGQTLENFLEEYDPYKYKNPCVTTDAVIFSCKKWRRQKTCCVIRIIPAGVLPLRLPFPPRAILFSCSKNTRT